MSFDAELALHGAKAAAAWAVPTALREWREDITQDIVEMVLRALPRPSAQQQFRWLALKAVRRTYTLLKLHSEGLFDDEAEVASGGSWDIAVPLELKAIALWRLQKLSAELPEIQQLALSTLLAGDSIRDTAKRHGIRDCRLRRATEVLLLRLNGGTPKQHGEGALKHAAWRSAQTHCPRGHPYAKDKTQRRCRVCEKEARRRRIEQARKTNTGLWLFREAK